MDGVSGVVARMEVMGPWGSVEDCLMVWRLGDIYRMLGRCPARVTIVLHAKHLHRLEDQQTTCCRVMSPSHASISISLSDLNTSSSSVQQSSHTVVSSSHVPVLRTKRPLSQ